MKRIGAFRAFTIMEAMVVLAISCIVAAILIPVFVAAKRHSKISNSQSNLRQLYLAVQLYRNDYDGIDVWEYYAYGLPSSSYVGSTKLGLGKSVFFSPCGSDRQIHESAKWGADGQIHYAPGAYNPELISQPGLNIEYKTYLRDYRQNSVLFFDLYCNAPRTDMAAPLIKKRALAVLLSGQIVNRIKLGNAQRLHFFSDPPND